LDRDESPCQFHTVQFSIKQSVIEHCRHRPAIIITRVITTDHPSVMNNSETTGLSFAIRDSMRPTNSPVSGRPRDRAIVHMDG